jgi:U3 small nucleolar RNA-associated protein 6
MAEHVQEALDQMVAPLRDLMERNIFSESEIKAIVARRRESEYLLRRMSARKADFLRYIEQEIALERLRDLRTKQRKRDHRKKHDEIDGDDDNGDPKKEKQHIGDAHIVQHVHLLFVRAIRKFRSDISLHLQHAEFCKEQKSFTRLGRVYAEALQIFPRQAGLWIEAASHEFFGPTRSIRNARVLLQRGLRLNETSEELWLEYFSLELHYAQTLKGRRQILQQKVSPEQSLEAAKEEYKIPAIVLKNAMKAIPHSVQFRLQFMDTCKRFPNTEFLMEIIQKSMERDFDKEPECWIARALYEAERKSRSDGTEIEKNEGNDDETTERPLKKARIPEGTDSVIAVLEEAVETLPTDDMLLQAFRFAKDYQKELGYQDADEASIAGVEKFIQSIWRKADTVTSPDLAIEHVNYLMNSENVEEARETIKEFCMSQNFAPAKAWLLWTRLTPRKKQKAILERALRKLSMDLPDYMVILLQLFGAEIESNAEDKKLFDLLQRILLLAPKTVEDVLVEDTGLEFELSTVFDAYLACLVHLNKQSGIRGARKVYSAVLFQSSVKLSEGNVDGIKRFLDTCLEMEQAAAPCDSKFLRRLYDKAIEIYGGTSLEEGYRQDRNDKAIFA